MRRAAIRHGDPTTTGGFVTAFSSTIHDDGKKVALTGDEATCGICKGVHKIYGTGRGMSELGRVVVLDGDRVLCPCEQNRVIVGANPGIHLESSNDHAGAQRHTAPTSEPARHCPPSDVPDEQVRVSHQGVALHDIPYFIQTASGRTFEGRASANGLLPRVINESAYRVYWGDEALAKQAGS